MPRVKKDTSTRSTETSETEGQKTDVKVEVTKKPKQKTKPTVKITGHEAIEDILGSNYGVVLKQCAKLMQLHCLN